MHAAERVVHRTVEQPPDSPEPKRALLERLTALTVHCQPALIYFLTLYHLFKDLGDELDEERIVKSATGIRNTTVWKKLFKFQRDGVIGAIDKLERFGGCIIADSVGLGKTFEALAIIKYFELRELPRPGAGPQTAPRQLDAVQGQRPSQLPGTFAVFGLGDSVLATVPLASGSFPKLDAVFATFTREMDHYETVKLTTSDLAALLARTSVMSTNDHQVVRLSIGQHRLSAEMRTPEVGESKSSIDVAWADNRPVTLDVQLLREGLAVLQPNERVWLSIPDKALPLKLFTDNFTYIVIPFGDST